MEDTQVFGIDPGLVHTGLVGMRFFPRDKVIMVDSQALVGLSIQESASWVRAAVPQLVNRHVFIEGYRPRTNLQHDRRMSDGVQDMRRAILGSHVLDNMGVKRVVKPRLMELLGVWLFTTKTNHQDLRSAARIALLGMLKDDDMNQLIAEIVRDHVRGEPWVIS